MNSGPELAPGIAALVDLLIELAVDDFFAELENSTNALAVQQEAQHAS